MIYSSIISITCENVYKRCDIHLPIIDLDFFGSKIVARSNFKTGAKYRRSKIIYIYIYCQNVRYALKMGVMTCVCT